MKLKQRIELFLLNPWCLEKQSLEFRLWYHTLRKTETVLSSVPLIWIPVVSPEFCYQIALDNTKSNWISPFGCSAGSCSELLKKNLQALSWLSSLLGNGGLPCSPQHLLILQPYFYCAPGLMCTPASRGLAVDSSWGSLHHRSWIHTLISPVSNYMTHQPTVGGWLNTYLLLFIKECVCSPFPF